MQFSMSRLARSFLIAPAVVASLLVGGIAAAQDASPAATTGGMPAHIHEGSCETLGAPVYPLTDLLSDAEVDTAQPAMEHATDVFTSVTTVDASLDDLIAGDYAINVHLSVEEIDVYVACADITGVPRFHMRSDAPYGLVLPMRELNDSGYAGMAWLEPTGDGGTTVTVFLATGLIGPGPNAGG